MELVCVGKADIYEATTCNLYQILTDSQIAFYRLDNVSM